MTFRSQYLHVRNNQNTPEKCQNFEKIQVRSDDNVFSKISAKFTKFQVSSLGL